MRSFLIDTQFWLDNCKRVFGDTIPTPDAKGTNEYFGGLDISGENIYFVNGSEDPW